MTSTARANPVSLRGRTESLALSTEKSADDLLTEGVIPSRPSTIEGLEALYGKDVVADIQSLRRRAVEPVTYGGFGASADPAHKRVQTSLTELGKGVRTVAAATDLLPWNTLAGDTANLEPDVANRAAGALSFLFESAPLPEEVRRSLTALLCANRNRNELRTIWNAALQAGAIDVPTAIDFCGREDEASRLMGLRALVRATPEDIKNTGVELPRIIKAALTNTNPEMRKAALNLARRIELPAQARLEIQDNATRMLSNVDDEGKPYTVLWPSDIAAVFAGAKPDVDTLKRFYNRCFAGKTTPDQHINALWTIGMFEMSDALRRAVIDGSITQFPHSLPWMLTDLENLGLSTEMKVDYLKKDLELVRDYQGFLEAHGHARISDKNEVRQTAEAAAGFMQGLGQARLDDATLSELFDEIVEVVQDKPRALGAVVLNCWPMLADGHPLKEKAVALIERTLASGEVALATPALNGIVRSPDDALRSRLLRQVLPMLDGKYVAVAMLHLLRGLNGAEAKAELEGMLDKPELSRIIPDALLQAGLPEADTAALLEQYLAGGNANTQRLAEVVWSLRLDEPALSKVVETLGRDANADVRAALLWGVAEEPGKLESLVSQDLLDALRKDPSPVVEAAALDRVMTTRMPDSERRALIDQSIASRDRREAARQAITDPEAEETQMWDDEYLSLAIGNAVAKGPYTYDERKVFVEKWIYEKTTPGASAAATLIARSPEGEDANLNEIFSTAISEFQSDEDLPVDEYLLPIFVGQMNITDEDGDHIEMLNGTLEADALDDNGEVREEREGGVSGLKTETSAEELEALVPTTPPEVTEKLTEIFESGATGDALVEKLVAAANALPPEYTEELLAGALNYEQEGPALLNAIEEIRRAGKEMQFDPAKVAIVEGIPLAKNTDPNRRKVLVPDFVPMVDVGPTKANRRAVAEAWALAVPTWLKGPPGNGKTAIIREMCARTQTPFRRYNLSPYTDKGELIGRWIPDETGENIGVFAPGPVLQAAMNGECLLLDEGNLAPGDVFIALNGLTDARGYITVPGFNNGEPFKPHPNFRIFLASNDNSEAGREAYDEAILDRWNIYAVDPLTKQDLHEILAAKYGQKIPAAQVGRLLALHERMASAVENYELVGGAGNIYFSVRNIERVCTRFIEHRRMGADGRPDKALDDAIMRREAAEIYCQSFIKPDEVEKVQDILDTIFKEASQADVDATIEFKKNPELEGTYLLEKTDEGYKLGDIVWPVLDNGGANIPIFENDFVLTERSAMAMYRTMKAFLNGETPLLVGDRGCGKTQLLRYLAKLAGQDCYDTSFERDTDPSVIIGAFQPDGRFHDGHVTKAIRNDAMYIGDELNVPITPVIERLNCIGDGEDFFYIPENGGEVLSINRDRFRMAGAINPADEYANRSHLSGAWLNRSTVIGVPGLNDPDELKLILAIMGQKVKVPDAQGNFTVTSVPKKVTDALVDLCQWVNTQTSNDLLQTEEDDQKQHNMRTLERMLRYVAKFQGLDGENVQEAFCGAQKFFLKMKAESERPLVERKARVLCGLEVE